MSSASGVEGPGSGSTSATTTTHHSQSQPPTAQPLHPAQLPEDSIEYLQKEIENLKKRITEERLKLCDKSIVQVNRCISLNSSDV